MASRISTNKQHLRNLPRVDIDEAVTCRTQFWLAEENQSVIMASEDISAFKILNLTVKQVFIFNVNFPERRLLKVLPFLTRHDPIH